MTGVLLPGAPVGASDDPWPVDLDVAAVELVTALRWQLGRLRLTTLNPDGLIARRRVWAGRNRVFTLISGMPGADPLVIERALQLALGVAPPATATAGATSTTTADLDASLTTAVNLWQALELPALWKAVAAYVTGTKANLAEQVMLLTYLETILPVDPAADPNADLTLPAGDLTPGSVPDVTDLVAATSLVSVSDDPMDVFAACGSLTLRGAEASTGFSIQVALHALAMLAPDLG